MVGRAATLIGFPGAASAVLRYALRQVPGLAEDFSQAVKACRRALRESDGDAGGLAQGDVPQPAPVRFKADVREAAIPRPPGAAAAILSCVNDEVTNWATLRDLRSGLSATGLQASDWALDHLERLLGPSWPRRQFDKHGFVPPELWMHGTHRAALPRFLAFATRLHDQTDEPTFAPVLSSLRKGVSSSGWRHILLQLEVARLARALSLPATFEPEIEGSDRRADVVLDEPVRGQLVETTTLLRADPEQEWHAWEDRFQQELRRIEVDHGVHIAARLSNHGDDSNTRQWLARTREAAARVSAGGGSEAVVADAGQIDIQHQPLAVGARRFIGAPYFSDGWRRLGRALRAKARQSAGARPAWLRVDAADGLFQFTNWVNHTWPDRLRELRDVVTDEQLDDLPHFQGVVISSGPALCLGATDPREEDRDAAFAGAFGLRRLLMSDLVRETFIISVRPEAQAWAEYWRAGYDTESRWTDEDLARHGLSAAATCWKA